MRLLIADDEAWALKQLRKLLQDADCDVISEHPDGVSVLEWLKEHPGEVDALFLDIKMPGLGGLQVAEALKEAYPIIFVTAWEEYVLQAWELAALDYLEKPLTPPKINRVLVRLRALLDHRR